MKKNILFLFLFTLLNNYFLFSQSVTINAIQVDNIPINNKTINLGSKSNSTVTFTCTVNNPSSPSDSNPGTIAIYYQKQPNATYPAINPTGGNSKGLLFLKGTQVVVSFSISLSGSQFDSAGGILYAEYKTYAGTSYKSGNISIIKNSTTPTPPTPTPPTNTPVFVDQTIPWGGVPVLFDLNKNQRYVEIKYVIKAIGSFIPIFVPVPQVIDFVNGPTYDNKILRVETKLEDGTTVIEPVPTGMNIIVEPFLSNASYSWYSLNNQISPPSQYVPIGQNPVTIGNPASESYSEGGVIITNPLNRYQWQIRRDANCSCPFLYAASALEYYGWKDIENATEANYTPPPLLKYGFEYRRLVFRNGETNPASSNVVRVYPFENVVNSPALASLCCNQTLSSNFEISPIVDSVTNGYWTFGWEMSSDGELWYKIENSKSQDYQPEIKDFIDNDGSFQSRFFRKIQYISIQQREIYYVSNVIKITINNTNKKSVEKIFKNDYVDTSIIVHPNPSSSFVKIEGEIDLSSSKIKIVDISGKNLIYEKPIIGDNNKSLQINISTFPIGVYFLMIENLGETIVKKIIKK